MSPQNRSDEISLYQKPPYVIHLQTVWRLYGDDIKTHRFSVPADVDQDDLITLESWTPRHGSLTLNPADRHRPHPAGASLRPAPTTEIDLPATRSHRGDHRPG